MSEVAMSLIQLLEDEYSSVFSSWLLYNKYIIYGYKSSSTLYPNSDCIRGSSSDSIKFILSLSITVDFWHLPKPIAV